jgi:hypothetical protein
MVLLGCLCVLPQLLVQLRLLVQNVSNAGKQATVQVFDLPLNVTQLSDSAGPLSLPGAGCTTDNR